MIRMGGNDACLSHSGHQLESVEKPALNYLPATSPVVSNRSVSRVLAHASNRMGA